MAADAVHRKSRALRSAAERAGAARPLHAAGPRGGKRGSQNDRSRDGRSALEKIGTLIERALQSGEAVRLHTSSGEVLVAQVLAAGEGRIRCRVLTSSRPENHAHCDSTGLDLALDEITRAALLERSPGRRP